MSFMLDSACWFISRTASSMFSWALMIVSPANACPLLYHWVSDSELQHICRSQEAYSSCIFTPEFTDDSQAPIACRKISSPFCVAVAVAMI